MKQIGALVFMVLALGACDQNQASAPAPSQASASSSAGDGRSDGRSGVTAERYDRDRALCRADVDQYTKTRRNVDDSRRDVFAGNYDRFGQGDLQRDMANYGDSRSTERLIANCMEARGWPNQPRPWAPKFASW